MSTIHYLIAVLISTIIILIIYVRMASKAYEKLHQIRDISSRLYNESKFIRITNIIDGK